MSAKSNEIELSEDFIVMWREEHCTETKMKKTKVCKECQINFRFFQTDIFE